MATPPPLTPDTQATFDVVIIGAGIQGAGVAQAMAAEGYRVALVEQAGQPATQTSSKSSKLIHGGLRYLETAEFSLVRECLRERRILIRVAPTLVKPQPFYIPVYRGQKRSPFWIHLGLQLYRCFGGGACRKHALSKAKALGLKEENLQALFEYEDAQTDDVKLTCAVVKSAESIGASVFYNFNVAACQSLSVGYEVKAADGRRVKATAIVNAAGAYVNHIAQCHGRWPTVAIDLVQGAHLILDLPAPARCIYTESPDDGRAVFLLPWHGKLMVGTTELSRGSDPEINTVTQAERGYLLRVVAHALHDVAIEKVTVLEAFSGLRVLPIQSQAARPPMMLNKTARGTRLVHQLSSQHQYLAIYGGKLTAYRAMAQKVVAKLKPFLPATQAKHSTEQLPLS